MARIDVTGGAPVQIAEGAPRPPFALRRHGGVHMARHQVGEGIEAILRHLIIATPSAEELLYADGSSAEAIGALSALAHDRFAKAERGVSPGVFEWQPERGWSSPTRKDTGLPGPTVTRTV